jgi:hypothetical protein
LPLASTALPPRAIAPTSAIMETALRMIVSSRCRVTRKPGAHGTGACLRDGKHHRLLGHSWCRASPARSGSTWCCADGEQQQGFDPPRRGSENCQSGILRPRSPAAGRDRSPGSWKRQFGPAEEALADHVADRRELAGDVGCGDERWTPSKRAANASTASSPAKSTVTRTVCVVIIVFVPCGLIPIGIKPFTDHRHRSRKLIRA